MIQTLQDHMQVNIGMAIRNPIIDGGWHSGRCGDGKGADKISYVGHYLPKGLLVRYRDQHAQDSFYVWREWEGKGDFIPDNEYQQRKAEAAAAAQAANLRASVERADLLAILQIIFTESVPASHNHPYISGKLITPIGARQVNKRYQMKPETTGGRAQYIEPSDLLIPVYDHSGTLQGIQQITAQGRKFARGTFRHGLLWIGGGLTTGEVVNRLYIAEGYATAVSIHMRTRNPVIVAFSTGNLLAVGHWARGRYPDAGFVYAVDNDLGSFITVGGERIENPGKYYATQAALAIGAAVVAPPLVGRGDWNDWHINQIAGEKIPDKRAA
jgi:phage/plasmid primase-like uncharacterized protein